jgi:hypothetical protein
MTIYPSTFMFPLRRGLIDFAHQIGAKHHFTLNFHDWYTTETAIKRVRRWDCAVMRRLFGRRCYTLPPDQVIQYLIFPEHSGAGHVHFHGPIRVPDTHLAYFTKIAEARWKSIIPTGSFHFAPIKQTEADYEDLFTYITKTSTAAPDLIHSSMLRNQ